MESADKAVIRTIFSIFVELMQNVIRYSAEKDVGSLPTGVVDLRYGILTVGSSDGNFFLGCGNVIANEDVKRLDDGLDRLQSLDQKELRTLYKEILKGETPEGSKGAGVGFVEIARRAKHGFKYDFEKMDNNQTFFAIKAFI